MDNNSGLLRFQVENNEYSVHPSDVTPETTLNTFLREKSHLTATKRMCLEGGCGCCIVAVEISDHNTQQKKVMAVNSCLVSIYSCHGWTIHTNEGIGGRLKTYHPLQEGLAKGNGTQCGFCSSGMVMNMYALLESGPVTAEMIENSFGGNICRCTGYRPILESFRKFTTEDIEDYKPCKKTDCQKDCPVPCNNKTPLYLNYGKSKWMKVYVFSDLLETLETVEQPCKLVAGNTAKGVFKKDPLPQAYIDVTSIRELTTWKLTENMLTIGGNTSLNDAIKLFKDVSKQNKKLSYLSKLADHIMLMANVPVRNIGTIAGNLMIKHTHNDFPSDMFLMLETVAATLVIDTSGNETRVTPKNFLPIDMNRKVIKQIILHGYDELFNYGSYKVMPRAENVHAVVNAGFLFKINKDVIETCTIVYGSINPRFIHATNTENYLTNKHLFDNNTLQGAFQILNDELDPDYVPPCFTVEYRRQLAIALLYKFVLSIAPANKLSSRNKSGGLLLNRPISTGRQEFGTNIEKYPVSAPIIKLEALAQTSGSAEYIDDKPMLPGQLFAQFVEAKAPANSIILSIDASEALKYPGVVTFLGKDDIPGKNTFTPIAALVFVKEEELFCSGVVQYFSQPVGIIVARNEEAAINACEMVKVKHLAPAQKIYLNIKEVLEAPVVVKSARVVHLLDFIAKKKGFDVKKTISGDFYLDTQYHFHMETQCCDVIPQEDGVLVYPATQWMDAMQIGIANVLGIPTNKVNVEVRRLGGSFGGKVLRSGLVASATALAAYKLGKPVKMRMPLEKNMRIIGKRYPFYMKYKVGVNSKGVIQYLKADLYSDFGTGANEIIETLLLPAFQSGYNSDSWYFSTYYVKTDTHANCYTRAPGSLECVGGIEAIMEHIAYTLNLDAVDVKQANLNQTKYPNLVKFTKDILAWSSVDKRKKEIAQYNNNNRWKKRGISVVPMCWTLELLGAFNVLVTIFHADGSVAVSHGGIEIGQGINTKAAQVCAYKLGIPLEMVSIKPSSTITAPNSFMTAASMTSESVCAAIIQACDILLERLKPIRNKLIKPPWVILVQAAWGARINLSAGAMFHPKGIFDSYEIFGVTAVDVEVDVLTGQHQIINVDIIEDVGDSMNPLIDIGQVEGAFMMGVGYYTMEQIQYNKQGEILTDRTWTYYPPGPKDIPQNFRIKFPTHNPNKVGVLNSKAIGEPPTCLSAGVPLAIRHAVSSARTDSDPSMFKWYPFDGCSSIESTFLNSGNSFQQYTL